MKPQIRTENSAREVVTIFFAQRRIILRTFLAIMLGALAIVLFYPPRYDIRGSILVKSHKIEKSPDTLEDTEIKTFEVSKEDLASEVEILSSHDVIAATVRKLHDSGRAFNEPELDEAAVKKHVRTIRKALTATLLPDSNIIEVSLTSGEPDTALMVLSTLLDEYVNRRARVFNPQQAVDFYQAQVEKFDTGLKAQEAKLIELVRRTGSADPALEIENNLAHKKDLESELDQARSQWIEKERYLKLLRDGLDSGEIKFFSSIENSSINNLGAKLQDLVLERGNKLRIFAPASSEIQAITEQIDTTFAALRGEVRSVVRKQANEAETLGEKVTTLESRLDELAARNIQLHGAVVEKEAIERQMDLLKHSYDTFSKRLEEARINASSDASNLFNISILSRPFYSGVPVFPNPVTFIPVALFVALLTGCSLGFLREYFDHTFKTPQDSEKYAGLPTIFSIPHWNRGGK